MMPEAKKRRRKAEDGNPWPERLRELRRRAGLTQAAAAKKLRVTLGGWQRWEYGNRMPSGPSSLLLELFIAHPEKF